MNRQKIFLSIFFIGLSACCMAQKGKIDSLQNIISQGKNDTSKVKNLLLLSTEYMSSSPADAIRYSDEAMKLAEKLGYSTGIAFAHKNIGMVYYNQTKYPETIEHWSQSYLLFDSIGDKVNEALLLNNIGSVYMNQGDDPKALEYYFKSLEIAEQTKDDHKIAIAMGNIGTIYSNNKFTYNKAIGYYLKALDLSKKLKDQNIMGGLMVNIGETYMNRNEDDSALYYFNQSLDAYSNTENIPYSLNDIGKIYTRKKNFTLASQYHTQALSFAKKFDLKLDIAQSYLGLGNTNYNKGDYANALVAYKNAQVVADSASLKRELRDAYKGLALAYAGLKNFNDAYKYQTLYTNIKDTLFNLDIAQKVNNLQTNFEIQKKQTQIDNLTKDKALQKLDLQRQKFARNTLAVSLVCVFIVVFVLLKLYRKVNRRTLQLRRSLEELKSTQAQLIQSEKMASLGLLTAGIGHEIQNPLNFVNNFSEVNVELLHDLKDGPIKKLNSADQLEADEILTDLTQNMERIIHHGKRADIIIKGMLQHSRVSTGAKELTDLNSLADEYLRLSYHGFRAKNKIHIGNLVTDFDSKIGEIKIVPQDVGSVLLNLYNNAFYSVNEKKKKLGDAYEPKVVVTTKMVNGKVEIRVRDNGMGIPKKALDKIFQPFFTTKPTGEGTGLGLSLSYDIVTQEHGGTIRAETTEGEGAEFIIQLPA
ncbi:tetratricopeptide repeat protein [Ginsengibacter hankyongi]|uniref:histidine kinase n=1 Tax=Ginsengibacter hankyongi TaxID=2607284 RepID=A0A5J5IBB6_9BACT|nr:tetratricopeptide repeat protein [Ginsengibacter hankyongi]KAA9034427.1 tetratricopeptide repeat protein [Ginsengibacter hankyongi]